MTAPPAARGGASSRHPSGNVPYLERGSREYWHASLALLFAGYATFSLLYYVQPLLPEFSRDFGVSPAQSSLALSLSTIALAASIFVAGFASASLSRHRLMTASLTLSALLTLGAACAPNWHTLLVLRLLTGVALGGVPAVAMAYLAEEVHPSGLGLAMGLYVGGTAIGGMAGRVITGVVGDFWGWRAAAAAIGVLGLLSMLAFRALLPPSRHFTPRGGFDFASQRALLAQNLTRGWELPALFLMGFALMGSFVTLYNYLGYRLLAPPYRMSQAAIGAIFVVYLVGVVGSPWSGRMADTLGRGRVLLASVLIMLAGIVLTLFGALPVIVAGIACVTFGFFAGHAVASGWVGRLAQQAKGQAAALYLLAYYLGSSLVGSFGGHCWSSLGWPGVAGLAAAVLLAGGAAALWLWSRERIGAA